MTLAGKRVLVTGGGGRGMGSHLVRMFHAEGAKVITCDVSEEGLAEVRRDLPDVETMVGSVASAEDCGRLLELAGDVDVLCNHAAGGLGISAILEETDASWNSGFDVTVHGAYRLIRGVMPGMIERGDGCIINTASVAGLRGGRGGAGYTASKFALVGMTLSIAATYGDTGVRCNAICPGPMGPPERAGTTSQDSIPGLTDLGRRILTRDNEKPPRALSEEVAALAIFLASDAARRINGACIPVDSGWIAY